MCFRLRHNRSNTDRRFFAIPINLAVVFKIMAISLWFTSFCHASKDALSWSSSSFSYMAWKPAKPTTAVNGIHGTSHRIAALAPKATFGSTRLHRSIKQQSTHHAPYYTLTLPITGSQSGTFFSRKSHETEYDARDESDDQEKKKQFGKKKSREGIGIFRFLGDFRYGANCVHNDFVGLSLKVYSKTILCTAPFVVLFFIILPIWSSSSSPILQMLASNSQGFLTTSFEILAEGARTCFVRPVHALVQWMVSWCSPAGTSTAQSAWKIGSSSRNLLLWAILIGPIVEEFVFRLAFRSLWKVLFRPVATGSNSNDGISNSSGDQKKRIERLTKSALGVQRIFLSCLLSSVSLVSSSSKNIKPHYTNRSWRIASGICFAIAHLPNFFPIDTSRYIVDGEIRLPSGSVRERFLLRLFPGDFASQTVNKEYCLNSMALIGAIYQAMHCFINTIILYGPLLDSTLDSSSENSKRGGIFAAIGAHAAWNANAIWLFSNIKCRLFMKLVALPFFQSVQQQKKYQQYGPESSKASSDE